MVSPAATAGRGGRRRGAWVGWTGLAHRLARTGSAPRMSNATTAPGTGTSPPTHRLITEEYGSIHPSEDYAPMDITKASLHNGDNKIVREITRTWWYPSARSWRIMCMLDMNRDRPARRIIPSPSSKKTVVQEKTALVSTLSDDGVEEKPLSSVMARTHYARMDDHDGICEELTDAVLYPVIILLTFLMGTYDWVQGACVTLPAVSWKVILRLS